MASSDWDLTRTSLHNADHVFRAPKKAGRRQSCLFRNICLVIPRGRLALSRNHCTSVGNADIEPEVSPTAVSGKTPIVSYNIISLIIMSPI